MINGKPWYSLTVTNIFRLTKVYFIQTTVTLWRSLLIIYNRSKQAENLFVIKEKEVFNEHLEVG